MNGIIVKIKKHSFMFQELVKRDFKQKYKRTVHSFTEFRPSTTQHIFLPET